MLRLLKHIDNLLSRANDNNYSLVLGGNIDFNMLHDSPLRRNTLGVVGSNACIYTITSPTRISRCLREFNQCFHHKFRRTIH